MLAPAVPVWADGPSRQLEYTVVASSGGVDRHATVRVDFVGGSAERLMIVNVGEIDDRSPARAASVGILAAGGLRVEGNQQLTSEAEAICSFMSLESEDLIAMGPGDRWERKGVTAGGRYVIRYVVTSVSPDGYMQFNVTRDVLHDDGSIAHWTGTLTYDVNAVVPSQIALAGDAALSIRLSRDTFKR